MRVKERFEQYLTFRQFFWVIFWVIFSDISSVIILGFTYDDTKCGSSQE